MPKFVESSQTNHFTATERLFLTADKERVVPADDPDAALLFATEGDEIDPADVEKYGLGGGAKAAPAPANKEAPAPANKAARK